MVALATEPAMLDVMQVASLLNCSSRDVYRLRDGGLMPKPIKLGGLMPLWPRSGIDAWIEQGCPRVGPAVSASKRRLI